MGNRTVRNNGFFQECTVVFRKKVELCEKLAKTALFMATIRFLLAK
jgi:hypothetical protein